MKTGTAVGCIAVLAGTLLATVTSGYANHRAKGEGTYATAPKVASEFRFVTTTVDPDFVYSKVAQTGGPTPFQAFLFSTAVDAFTIAATPEERTVTITGEMVSTTLRGVGSARQAFTEIVPFTAVGVDKRPSAAGADVFSLTVKYRANQAQGPLFESLGYGDCGTKICTMTFEGPVKKGYLVVHTAGGE